MYKSLLAAAAVATLLAACSPANDRANNDNRNADGSPAAQNNANNERTGPGNEAVDTTPVSTGEQQSAGATSYTESQAREAITRAGYTGVGALTQNAQGHWEGTAMKGGASTTVSVDFKGTVTP